MSAIKISDLPTLARWTEIGVAEDDNTLHGFINDLRDNISSLVLLEDDYAPARGEEPSREYQIINQSCRTMALLLADLKAIRREVHTARLLNDNGKGGKR